VLTLGASTSADRCQFIIHSMDWLEDALCKGINPDFFFPPLDAQSPNHYYAIGKYVCYACPVWKECLAYCESNDEVWGLWGGFTPQDRKKPHTLRHGSIEYKRFGCTCQGCRNAPNWDDVYADVDTLPMGGLSYDLLSLVYDLTKG